MPKPYPHDKLPTPVLEGFESKLSNTFYRQPMDDGNFRSRRVYDSQPMREKLSWILSWEQLALWEAWAEYDLNGGVGEFTLRLTPVAPEFIYSFANDPEFSFVEARNSWLVSVEVHRDLAKPEVRHIDFLPDWPAELPEPEKSNYSFTIPGQVTYGNITGAGDPGARRRFNERVVHYSAKWLLTSEQLEIFWDFVNNDLAAGNAHFKAPFANGMGFKLAKSMFMTTPVVTTQGSKFNVSGTLATSSATLMSKGIYLTGGRMSFNDVVTLQDFILVQHSRSLGITDFVNLQDLLVRNYFRDDSISLVDSLRYRTGREVSDSLSFSELFKLGTETSQAEEVGLLDTINIAFRKPLSESLKMEDSILLAASLIRYQADEVGVGDELTHLRSSFIRRLSDSLDVRDFGTVHYQNYVESGYFAEDYIESEISFIGSEVVKETDFFGVRDSGVIAYQNYVQGSYLAEDYIRTYGAFNA